MITVKFFGPEQFSELKNIWEELYLGDDMTCFQNYYWYEGINKLYLDNAFSSNNSAVYLLAEDDGLPIMIAPFHIVKHGISFKGFGINKGIYFIGTQTHTDYLNFIYKDFSSDAFNKIIYAASSEFKIKSFYFEQIAQGTQTDLFLTELKKCSKVNTVSCVEISPSESFDDYYKSLSKSVRQNLRTASNRASKNGLDIHFRVFDRIDKSTSEILFDIYKKRVVSKNTSTDVNLKTRIIAEYYKKYNHRLQNRLFKSNYITYSMQNNINQNFILIIYSSDKPIGFCFGLKKDRKISIMIVSFDEEFKKYSPGMIGIFKYIQSCYNNNDIPLIDLTRGNEKYKYDLGGKDHYLNYFNLNL